MEHTRSSRPKGPGGGPAGTGGTGVAPAAAGPATAPAQLPHADADLRSQDSDAAQGRHSLQTVHNCAKACKLCKLTWGVPRINGARVTMGLFSRLISSSSSDACSLAEPSSGLRATSPSPAGCSKGLATSRVMVGCAMACGAFTNERRSASRPGGPGQLACHLGRCSCAAVACGAVAGRG